MSLYRVLLSRSARKELEALSPAFTSRIIKELDSLQINPRSQNVKKLIGFKNLWRARVGDYRIIFLINDDTKIVDVSAIRHRKEAYK